MRVEVFNNFIHGADGLTIKLNNFLERIEEDHKVIDIVHTKDYTFVQYEKKSKPTRFPPTPRPYLEPTLGPRTKRRR